MVANFKVRYLSDMLVLSFCTLGCYLIYWTVSTKRELVRAGGRIPNAFLAFLPLISIYFWYRYAQAYLEVTQPGYKDQTLVIYFLLAAFGPYLSVAAVFAYNPPLPIIAVPAWILQTIYEVLLKYLLFQAGLNELSQPPATNF